MAGLGTRFTIERVKIGHSLPKAARACALLGERERKARAAGHVQTARATPGLAFARSSEPSSVEACLLRPMRSCDVR